MGRLVMGDTNRLAIPHPMGVCRGGRFCSPFSRVSLEELTSYIGAALESCLAVANKCCSAGQGRPCYFATHLGRPGWTPFASETREHRRRGRSVVT